MQDNLTRAREFKKRFTQIKGAYLTLKNMELRIYEAENFTVSARLIVPKIQFLGGEGEAIVGHPVFFTEHQEIRMLLRSPQVQGFLWPPLSVEQASEGTNVLSKKNVWDDKDEPLNELTRISEPTDDTKKRGFWSTHRNKDESHKLTKKRQRALHPGWRGLFEITYRDCIISDEQQKILKRDDSWYPPINAFQQEAFASDKTVTPMSKSHQKTAYSPNYSGDNLDSPPESIFSWEESPILNKSSASILETKINDEKQIFHMEKKEFFSDNDTLPPSSSPTMYSP